jgi:Trk K+ transport system NAD-binding subunit
MILIDGNGALAVAIELRLRNTGTPVERIHLAGVEGEMLSAASLQHARVLVLASDDDSGNVDLALQTRRLYPALPLVVRLFDAALASYLGETISGVVFLSMSKVTAPFFAEAARKLLLTGPTKPPSAPRPGRSGPRYRVDRILAGALISLLVLVFPSALFFSQALNLRYIDALYFVWTTVMTVGYGDIALKDAGDGVKLFGMLLMLAGASFIAVLFALLSDGVLSRRLEVLQGRTRVHDKGHVVIAGAGNLGVRIAESLAAEGLRLVTIEARSESRNVSALRAAGHHVIVADATDGETLKLASLGSARLIIAVTDSDAMNLQIALHARAHCVPVVMRVTSPELSAHVTARGDAIAFSPIVTAAEAFSQAALAAAGIQRS